MMPCRFCLSRDKYELISSENMFDVCGFFSSMFHYYETLLFLVHCPRTDEMSCQICILLFKSLVLTLSLGTLSGKYMVFIWTS